MSKKKTNNRTPKKKTQRNLEKEINIIEGALQVFGEKGYEATTISAISKAANISDATLYEYFDSKEDVLFSITKLYTQRIIDKMEIISPYIHGASARLKVLIQTYLEFYENNPLYTSVVLLTVKGNRNFLKDDAYQVIRKSAKSIIDILNTGIEEGVFRNDIDPYLIRSMFLGFIEHIATQWLLIGRHDNLTGYRDTIYEMIMRVIAVEKDADKQEIVINLQGFSIDNDTEKNVLKLKKK